jgi:hypothetical protein
MVVKEEVMMMQYIIYHDGVDSDFEEVCDDDAKSLSTPS